MPLSGFLTTSSFLMPMRSVPVIASLVLHASIGAGLVATAGGHARAGTSLQVAVIDPADDVDATEAPLLLPVEAPARVDHDERLPPHTHAYPVAPSHDAHPHDPTLHHDGVVAPKAALDDHAAVQVAPPGRPEPETPPAFVAAAPALPRFTVSSGTAAFTGVQVAATVDGAGRAARGQGDDDVVHAASSVQVAARLVQSVTAAYPTHARADEIEGDVEVEIVVDREGRVLEARVTRPAGHGLDEAALSAVRAYRFSPAQRAGRAVRVRMPWSIQFRLR